MPFITEEIWQKLPGAGESIMVSAWPRADSSWRDDQVEQEMNALVQVVVAARRLRAAQKVEAARRVSIAVATGSAEARRLLETNREAILRLTHGSSLELNEESAIRPGAGEAILCYNQRAIVAISGEMAGPELEAQRARLEEELGRVRREEESLARKLENEGFLSRAPQEVVARVRIQYSQAKQRREALEGQLSGVDGSLNDRAV